MLLNSLYSAKDENSQLKAIDFGLLDFAKPDERLNEIVRSLYYVTLEVLHRSYRTEPDVWSIGVISYILLCGSRPFWARTESGTSRAVLKADPSFDEALWPSLSLEANYTHEGLYVIVIPLKGCLKDYNTDRRGWQESGM
ncbi:CDPK-related kinase, partial [Prunus dulcis]